MKKRILSFLLTAALLLSLIPAVALEARAAYVYETIEIRKLADDSNIYYDVVGDQSNKPPYGDMYYQYNGGVLTLHNFEGKKIVCNDTKIDKLTIVLEGRSQLTGFYSDIPVVIRGNGVLTIDGYHNFVDFRLPSLTIESGTLECTKIMIESGSLIMNGGSLNATRLEFSRGSSLNFNRGSLCIASSNFVYEANQHWTSYDRWEWNSALLPKISAPGDYISQYRAIGKSDDKSSTLQFLNGLPDDGCNRALLVAWNIYAPAMASFPEMPNGKKSTDVVVSTDAYEFSMNAASLGDGWMNRGYLSSETMVVTDSDGKVIWSKTNEDADATPEPLTYNMEGLPEGKYTVKMTVRFYDSNGTEKKSLTYTYNVDRQVSDVIAACREMDIGTNVTVELYKAGTNTPLRTMDVVADDYTYAVMAHFENLDAGNYDVKFKAEGYLDAVRSVTVSPGETGTILLENMVKAPLNFRSMAPYVSDEDLKNGLTDLGTVKLGSAETDIDFYGFPNKLGAEYTDAGLVTGRSITVTKDGMAFYSRTYKENEIFGWNLKDNIDNGGTYLITLKIFISDGSVTSEKSHTFQIKVEGSIIMTFNVDGIGTPVIGKAPSTINTATINVAGAYIDQVIWNYYSNEMGGSWTIMPAGAVFEEGKRYMLIVEVETNDGYSFPLDSYFTIGYINDTYARTSQVYSTDELALELEYTPITNPVFNSQPQSTEAPKDGSALVRWSTKFNTTKLEILRYQGNQPTHKVATLSGKTRSAHVDTSSDPYCIRAYYNDTDYVDSDKFYVSNKAPESPFFDVPADSFYNDPVIWAVENGITKGVSEQFFGPNDNCLRSQVVTFLWRAAGKPEPKSSTNPFVDVKTSDFFYKPVLWALENNITKGVDDTHFGPDQTCNRGQVVTFLWRATGKPEPTSSKNPFVDVKSSDFFYKPVLWALEKNITKGVDDTHFGPDQSCNRSQVVTFLYRTYGK